MHPLILDSDNYVFYLVLYIVGFIVSVYVTRWIFGIDKIIDALNLQNSQSLMQIRMMKKLLLHHGVSFEEIDEILEKGNQKEAPNKPVETESDWLGN